MFYYWIIGNCAFILRSLKKMLNGLCWDDDYTIAQWLEHRWLQARVPVPGSSPGGDSQFFLQTFPVCLFPSNQLIFYFLFFISLNSWSMTNWHAKCERGVIANHGKKRKKGILKKRRKKDRQESSKEILSYYIMRSECIFKAGKTF